MSGPGRPGQSLISGVRRKRGRFESGEKRDVAERRLLLDDRERIRAEAAPRLVDDAAQGLVRLPIVGEGRETKIGERNLDLGAGVEADVADDLLRDLGAHQRPFEGPRERVRAIEDRHVGPGGAFGASGVKRAREARGLALAVPKGSMGIGWPTPRLLKRVLRRRFLSPAITALAAARMCPVERKFSSSRTSAERKSTKARAGPVLMIGSCFMMAISVD